MEPLIIFLILVMVLLFAGLILPFCVMMNNEFANLKRRESSYNKRAKALYENMEKNK